MSLRCPPVKTPLASELGSGRGVGTRVGTFSTSGIVTGGRVQLEWTSIPAA